MSSDGSKCIFINASVTATFDVYYSTDYGVTFAKKGNSIAVGTNVPYIAMSDDGNTVIGTNANSAFAYVTTNFSDASPTWESKTITGAFPCRMVVANSTCSIIYTTAQNGIFKTTNIGTTWSRLLTGNWFGIAMSKDASTIVGGQYPSGSVYISRNSGVSFSQVTSPVPTNLPWAALAVSNNGKIISVSSYLSSPIYISYTSGVSWIAYTPPDITNYQIDNSIAIQNNLFIAPYNLKSNMTGGVGAVFMSSY